MESVFDLCVGCGLDKAEFERVLDQHPGMRAVLEDTAQGRLAQEAEQA